MKDEIIAVISSKLKEIYSGGTIYLDSVTQSTKDSYFALSIMESGTENVGIDTQNVSLLIDIALIDNKPNRNLINESVPCCGTLSNTITIDEQILFPKAYLLDEADDVQHIRFTLEPPRYIERSER